MNVYLPNLRLPSAYQEVEWIQGTGSQYINTGYNVSSDTNVKFKISGANFSSMTNPGYIFGYYYSRQNSMFGIYYGQWGDNNAVSIYGNSEVGNTSGKLADGGTHIGDFGKNGLYVDGAKVASFSSQTFSGGTLGIFCKHGVQTSIGEVWSEFGKFKLYYFQIYQGTTLVRDFVPCYRKSDNVIGLYDLVNSVFYTNAGTGTFSKGNDVTMVELKNDYIGEVWTPGANTLAYRPLKSDLKEASGKSGLDWSITRGSVSYSNNMATINTIRINSALITGTMNFTVLFYGGNFQDNDFGFCETNAFSGTYGWYPIFVCGRNGLNVSSGNNDWVRTRFDNIDNSILFRSYVRNGSNIYYYENGVLKASNTGGNKSLGTVGMYIGGYGNTNSSGTMGGLIIEKRARTAQEISHYYDITKSNYGL